MFIPFFLKFFPLKVNNLWLYKLYEKFNDKEYSIVKVIIEEKIPFEDKIIYIFGYYLDNEELKKESYIVNNDGLFLYARKLEDNLIVYDPLVSFLPINFDNQSWWSWEGKAGIIPSKIRFENKGFIEKEVLKISYIEENKLGKSNYNLYLKKDVGIVKEESDTPYFSYISELMDYNVDFDDFSMISFKDYNQITTNYEYNENSEKEEYFEGFEEYQEYENINEEENIDQEEFIEYEFIENDNIEYDDWEYYENEYEEENIYIDQDYKEDLEDNYKEKN
jgi:hypothetical protein